ncbi:MAG: amino-acid N-acetyltransferase, partial [Gammaproteobacteria bacterium]
MSIPTSTSSSDDDALAPPMASTRASLPQQAPTEFQNWFHHVAPYINQHREKTFVLCLPGEGLERIQLASFAADVALLQSLGIHLALVFGCRPQLEAAIQQHLKNPPPPIKVHEKRITDEATLDLYLKVCGKSQATLSAAFSLGLPHSPLYGAAIEVLTGNWIMAQPYGVHDGVDYQFTGKIRKIHLNALKKHLGHNRLLLLPTMGYSPTGECFNVCHDELALTLAAQLKAEKLIYLTDFNGLRSPTGERLREIQLPLRSSLDLADENMERRFRLAEQACEQGVSRVHLVSYCDTGSLLQELFTHEGSGTLITAYRIERIRTARSEDVGAIFELTHPLEAQGILVTRSREVVEKDIEKFSVIERYGAVIGCAALYDYPERIAELACVAVAPEYRGQQKGHALIHHMIQKARHQGLHGVFILTTQATHWFQEQGFQLIGVDQLPAARRATYNAA